MITVLLTWAPAQAQAATFIVTTRQEPCDSGGTLHTIADATWSFSSERTWTVQFEGGMEDPEAMAQDTSSSGGDSYGGNWDADAWLYNFGGAGDNEAGYWQMRLVVRHGETDSLPEAWSKM